MDLASLLLFSLGLTLVSVVAQDATAKTNEIENDNSRAGHNNFRFLTSNNIERSESGNLEDDGNFVVQGYYTFIATNGKKYYVSYVAGKTGYHPTVIEQLEHFNTEHGELMLDKLVVVHSLPPAIVATLLG